MDNYNDTNNENILESAVQTAAPVKKSRRRQLDRRSRIILIGILLLAVVLGYSVIRNGRMFTGYQVINAVTGDKNTNVSYASMKNYIIKYSSEGASLLDTSGKVVWNQAYQMASPTIAVNEDYAVIADSGSDTILIFNSYGEIGSVSTSVPVTSVEISKQGIVAAILSDTGNNYIQLYDKQGKALVSVKATLSNTGYPLSVGISPDAGKMAVSYLYLEGTTMKTKVVFYSFGSGSSEETDNIIDTEHYDCVIPKLQFLDNTHMVAVGEDRFMIYSVGETVTVAQEKELSDEIRSIFVGSDQFGLILNNNDETHSEKYRMEIYNLSGKTTSVIYTDFSYNFVRTDDDDIILSDGETCVVYNYGGRMKFYYTFSFTYNDIFPAQGRNEFWIVEDSGLTEIRLK